jgi:hypothetical protein
MISPLGLIFWSRRVSSFIVPGEGLMLEAGEVFIGSQANMPQYSGGDGYGC